MAKKFAQILDEGVAALEDGHTVEEVFIQCGTQAQSELLELQKSLTTAFLLRQMMPRVVPSPEAEAVGCQKLLTAVERKRQARARWGVLRRTLFTIKTQLAFLFSIPSEALRKL